MHITSQDTAATHSSLVNAQTLTVTKTADNATVNTGDSTVSLLAALPIWPGVAKSVTLSDALPGGTGISWAISPAYSGPGTCTITGTAPTQSLGCSFGNLASGATPSVHVTSATGTTSAGTYANTAKGSASN